MLCLAFSSCAGGTYLKTESVAPGDVAGNFTLLLHGHRYSNDAKNVAILCEEGGNYSFDLFAPEFDYSTEKHVPAKIALEKAEKFVSFHYAFERSRLSRIIGPEGNAIGYELRPLYSVLEFGYPDALDIRYVLKDSTVVVRIGFRPEVERRVFEREKIFPFKGP